MESDDLQKLIADCPLLIRMNDGREYRVEKSEFITVGDYTTSVLINDDGVMRHVVLSLMNIAAVVPSVASSSH
ncbi:hypothetical protein [Aeoliella sp. SH292]|uniref:hypothetical protein n=1 Tax=Aeoliella sp. SH292 TaxID=3454464 RepID=UPI003F979FF5